MYRCSKKLITYKEYSCFDFPVHSVFIFDVCWGSLGTRVFGNSRSAGNNTRSSLPSRLSFRFLWLWSILALAIPIGLPMTVVNEQRETLLHAPEKTTKVLPVYSRRWVRPVWRYSRFWNFLGGIKGSTKNIVGMKIFVLIKGNGICTFLLPVFQNHRQFLEISRDHVSDPNTKMIVSEIKLVNKYEIN